MRAGRLDRRIELQQFAEFYDGDPTSGQWQTRVEVWAQQLEQSQAERFVSEQSLSEVSRVYRIRYREDVEPGWRVKHGEECWYVAAAPEGAGRREETLLLCTRNDPNDREE